MVDTAHWHWPVGSQTRSPGREYTHRLRTCLCLFNLLFTSLSIQISIKGYLEPPNLRYMFFNEWDPSAWRPQLWRHCYLVTIWSSNYGFVVSEEMCLIILMGRILWKSVTIVYVIISCPFILSLIQFQICPQQNFWVIFSDFPNNSEIGVNSKLLSSRTPLIFFCILKHQLFKMVFNDICHNHQCYQELHEWLIFNQTLTLTCARIPEGPWSPSRKHFSITDPELDKDQDKLA